MRPPALAGVGVTVTAGEAGEAPAPGADLLGPLPQPPHPALTASTSPAAGVAGSKKSGLTAAPRQHRSAVASAAATLTRPGPPWRDSDHLVRSIATYSPHGARVP